MTRKLATLISVTFFALAAIACGGSGGSGGSGSSDLDSDEAFEEAVSIAFYDFVERDGIEEIIRVVRSSSGSTTFSNRDWTNSACPDGGSAALSIAGSNLGEGSFTVTVDYRNCRSNAGSLRNRVVNGAVQWSGSGSASNLSGSGTVVVFFDDVQWKENIADHDGSCSGSGRWNFSRNSDPNVEVFLDLTCSNTSFRCSVGDAQDGVCQ